jgi:hypothetical protein
MAKEETAKPIDKEDVAKAIDTIVSYMFAMDSSREAINEIVKRLKSDYGLAPSDVRAAATALKKQNIDEIDEKTRRIQELVDLCL